MPRYTRHHTQLNSLRLHHLEWDGEEPPIVYLPGFIANAYGALRLAKAVPTRRVMALDLRGRGASDKPQGPYGIKTHLADIEAWLSAHHLDPIILAGHSFGAVLALLFAHQYPKRITKIILFDGGAPLSDAAFKMFHAYHANLTYQYSSIEAYIAGYRTLPTLQPWTEEAEALVRANVAEQDDGTAIRVVPPHVVHAELDSLSLDLWQQLKDAYPQIDQPVLLIRAGMGSFGHEDRHITDTLLSQMTLPHLQVYDMPHTGHTGVLTVPDTGRDRAIRDFVT